DLAGHEAALHLGAALPAEAGVVDDDLLAELRRQTLRERLAALARTGVDDRRQRALLRQSRGDPGVLLGPAATAHDGEGEVGPIEAGRDAGRLAQPEPPDEGTRHLG